jgi:hypothetical protein
MVDSAEQDLAEENIRLARHRAMIAFGRAQESDSRLAAARAERVLGECLLAEGRDSAGEARLRSAIDGCRRVAAEYEEARTAVILAGHLHGQGQRGAARRLARRDSGEDVNNK